MPSQGTASSSYVSTISPDSAPVLRADLRDPVSGHSDQIPCRDHTEDDGFDEGMLCLAYRPESGSRSWSTVLLPMDFDGKGKTRLIIDNVSTFRPGNAEDHSWLWKQDLRKLLVDPLPPGAQLMVGRRLDPSTSLSHWRSSDWAFHRRSLTRAIREPCLVG